ncbi:MAG: hypothetical protein ACI9VR_004326 [Cognaticolwellia sp.]|jgi:hypothetical protein
MRNLKLYTSALILIGLTGCSAVGGALAGSALWGDSYSLDQDWSVSTMGVGTAVVCLGSDAEVESAESYVINGEVLSDAAATVDVGNVVPCAQDPMRVLSVRDDSGQVWEVGYAWVGSDGWNSTPAVGMQGQRVEIIVRQGEMQGSAGFAVYDRNGLSYAMEAGHGGAALESEDLGSIAVAPGSVVGSVDHADCGSADSVMVNFDSEVDQLSLYPGEDAPLQTEDGWYTTCNITSVEMDDCGESEVSWVMFR